MQITCPNCTKKFEVKKELIPKEGRLLQCGSCEHKWFYEINKIFNEVKNIKPQKEINEDLNKKITKKKTKTITKIKIQDDKEKIKIDKSDINYFKLFIVTIISFVALIIVVETFKNQISIFYPNLDIVLQNLYETLKDIKLFFIDLIK